MKQLKAMTTHLYRMVLLLALVLAANGARAGFGPDGTITGTSGNATWDAETKIYEWTASTGNGLIVTGLGDLTGQRFIALHTSELSGGEYRIYITVNGTSYYRVLSKTGDPIIVDLKDSNWRTDVWDVNSATNLPSDLSNATVYFAGFSNSGSIKINNIRTIELGAYELNDLPTFNEGNSYSLRPYGDPMRVYVNNIEQPDGQINSATIDGKKFIKLNGDGYFDLVFPKGTVTANDILRVDVANFYNGSDRTIGFNVEGGGQASGLNEADKSIVLNYVIKGANIQNYNDDYDKIRVTRIDYACSYHSFEIINTDKTVSLTWNPDLPTGCDAWYNIGDGTEHITSTETIPAGIKVVLHASDTDNENKKIDSWKRNGQVIGYEYDCTISELTDDATVTVSFADCHYYKVSSTAGGTAIVYDDANTKEDISNKKCMRQKSYVYYEATPDAGSVFDGWYDGDTKLSSETLYTLTNVIGGKNLTARFISQTAHPAITCAANTIDLSKLNTSSCTYDASTGNGTMNEANAYLSIKFASAVNLSELSSMVIEGTNLDKSAETPGVIDNVRFYYDGGDFGKYNTPTNITYFSDEQKENLKTVNEIRLFNGAVTGDFTITGIRFNFGGSHTPIAAPTLKDGTASVMTITVGEDLVLATNESSAIWREYKNGNNYVLENQTYTNIAQNKYGNSTTTIPGLGIGTYYFAAELVTDPCEFGKYHNSEFAKVTVVVKAPVTESEPYVYRYDLNNFPGIFGNVTSVTKQNAANETVTENPDHVEVITTGSSNNYLKLIDGPLDSKYSGIRVDSKGAQYRLIVKTNDGKTFLQRVKTSADYATTHYAWSDFVQQYSESNKMTAEDIANIKEIGVGGNDADHDEESFYVRNFWLDAVEDYDHTIVTYGEENGIYDGAYTYTLQSREGEVKAVFSSISGNDRSGKKCIILRKDRELNVTPPAGYRIATMRVSFSEKCDYSVSFNRGNTVVPDWGNTVPENDADKVVNGYSVDYTNTDDERNGVRFVIRGEAPDLTLKIAKIEYTLEALKIADTKTLENDKASNGRQYRIYAPAKVAGKTKVPVVFSLHGGAGDWEYERPNTKAVMSFNDVAQNDPEGFVVVYPRGGFYPLPMFNGNESEESLQTKDTERNWMSTGDDNADMEYLKDIIEDLKKETRFEIDEKRVYITGYSNGGMMAYAAANSAADVFAAFSCISGFPLNDFHLQHHGVRPVPFLHIHGSKDGYVNIAHMPTIIDNMALRNGLSYTPSSTVIQGNASFYGTQTKYDKYVYGASETSGAPFVFYSIGTGTTATDTGMGHNMSCEINGVSNTQVIWDFMKNFTLPDNTSDATEYNLSLPITSGNVSGSEKDNDNIAREHGWAVNEGQVIAAYGESGGYSDLTQGVYHSIQLNGDKKHFIKFTATNADNTKTVGVRLIKLGTLDKFSTPAVSFTPSSDVVLEKYYSPSPTGASIIAMYDATSDSEGGEYRLEFLRSSKEDKTTISGVVITTAGEARDTTRQVEAPKTTNFTGWFNYENRLVAQWDFDLCDGPRFITSALGSNWDINYDNTDTGDRNAKFGTITYTYKYALNDFEELCYDAEKKYRIPVAAGLLFKAPARAISFKVVLTNGVTHGTQLVLDEGVQMKISYAINSYRSDNGKTSPRDGEHFYEFKNCMHHLKRDIIYIADSKGDIWANIDKYDPVRRTEQAFNSGGDEFINGKMFNKLDHFGFESTAAVIPFTKTAYIDRIAVNRNCTYSLYTQYLGKAGYETPEPGLRILGSANGLRVSEVGGGGYFGDCLAVTYGGWANKDYLAYDNTDGNTVVDERWEPLTTYDGTDKNDYTQVPIPSDGFYGMSLNPIKATSEKLMPENTPANVYHPADEGLFQAGEYESNVTPWTLPCRGGYVKFEPTIPGVLNVHVYQEAGNTYYIADEFGRLVNDDTQNVCLFKKTGTNQDLNPSNGGFVLPTHADYVKYSFNVYPGKSYYVFSNTAGLGFMGCFFEPYVCRVQVPGQPLSELDRDDVLMPSLTLTDDEDYAIDENKFRYFNLTDEEEYDKSRVIDNPHGAHGVKTVILYSPKAIDGVTTPESDTEYTNTDKWQAYPVHYSRQAAKVTLSRSAISSTKTEENPAGYAFKQDTWSSICLPFSLNHLALEQIFGAGTRVVLLRDVQEENGFTTANFIAHENQDIIAGYPYFIYPTKNVKDFTANVSLYDDDDDTDGTNHLPKFKPVDSKTLYGGVGGYVFKGLLSMNENPAIDSYVMATNGKLTRIAKANNVIKPYRAYIEFSGEETPASRIAAMSIFNFTDMEKDGEATAIEDINAEDLLWNAGFAPKATNVYSISGQLIRENTVDLRGLPKGTYIVNGKKYLVK